MPALMTVTAHVKPGSLKGPLVVPDESADYSLTVFLQQKAVEGAANDTLVTLLA